MTSFNFDPKYCRREPSKLGSSAYPIVLIFIAVVALLVAAFFAVESNQPAAIAAVAGGVIAIVGLIFNSWFTGRQNRVKFTLDLHFARFNNAAYNDRAHSFYEHRALIAAAACEADLRAATGPAAGPGAAATATAFGETLSQHVLYMLNYWETLATAHVERHLDRDVFENVSGDLVGMIVERTAAIIGEKRRVDEGFFEYLVAVFWHCATPDQRARLVPLLGPPSTRLAETSRSQWAALQGIAPAPDPGGYAARIRSARTYRLSA